MSNELQTILNDIKDQKDNYLKPENIVEGVELLGVKGNLKLPKPIYNTTSYRTLTIPSPDTSKYTQIYMLYSLGDYIIVSWKTSSYGSNYYLYRKVNNQYELLGDTKIGSPTSYATNAVICSYNDNYVYIAQGQRNNQNYTLATFDIVNKKATSKSVSTSIYTSNFVWSDINGYFMSARINSGYLYKLNGTSSSPTTTTLKSFSNCEYVYNKMLRIFGYSSTAITKLSFDNGTPIQTSATAPKNIKGVNYYGNKIFLADGIYQLSEQLAVGEKLNDINITKSKIYPLNDKYYMSSASSNKVVLYEFDEDTNLFKEVETISSTCANGGYETSATLFGLNYIYDFTQGDTLLGYEIDNQNVYLNTLRQISTDSILSGYSAYNFSGNPIVGTMPNNGKLTYNPSIANQSIPKGYTDGGTILGVTNEIDSNIQPDNIKKDVVILNVTGTFEGASGEIERFDTVEEMQADTEVENGDLAVVYGDKFIDLPELEPFTKCKFPDTVVLESAPTEYKNYQGMGEANGAMLRIDCSLDSSSFDFYYTYENYDTGEMTDTSISYTSTDGLTYTRSTELVSELEFPGAITMTDWDENISKFIQTPVKEYNGFYEYKKDYETGNVEAKSSVSYDSTNKKFVSVGTGHLVSVDILNKFHEKIVEYYSEVDAGEVFISKDYKKLIWLSFTYSTPNLFLPDGEIYVPITDDRYTGTIKSFEYDIETETVSDFIMSTDTTTVTYSYSGSHTATVVPFTDYYLIGAVVKYADRKNVSVNGTYFFAFENGFTTQKAGNVSEPLLEILNEYTLVPGSLEQGVDTSDATATSADLINPKTAYVNGEKVVGNINKSTADTIIGTSDDVVEDFRTNILNALSGKMNSDESGINYTLYPQKYGTGDTSLDKPVTIYFVYENPEESCYDMIAIMTGNWNIKRDSNAGWNASVSRSEHHVTTTNGTDWRNGVWFYHYRINYNFEFVSKVTKSKEKTAVWGNQSMNALFGINSCLYENLLLVSPNYLSRMISNVSSFAVYKDRVGKSSYPSLNEELNLILNEKNTKIIPENIKKDVTILNVTGTLEQGVDTSDATATAEDLVTGKTAYVNGQKITGTISIITTNPEGASIMYANKIQSVGDTQLQFVTTNTGMPTLLDRRSNVAIRANSNEVADTIGLTPEKLVKGNTILGIEGTAETGGITEGAKIFESEEVMNSSINNNDGDLAIVYNREIKNTEATSVFQKVKFPDVVVLPQAFTGSAELLYTPVDGSIYMEANGMLMSSMYSFDCYTETGSFGVFYESSDGITYTRTDGVSEADFGTDTQYDNPDEWQEALGYFMQIETTIFKGPFIYETKKDNNYFQCVNTSSITFDLSTSGFSNIVYDNTLNDKIWGKADLINILNKIEGISNYEYPMIFMGTDNNLYALLTKSSYYAANNVYNVYDESKNLIGIGSSLTTAMTAPLYRIDFENETAIFVEDIQSISSANSNYQYFPISDMLTYSMRLALSDSKFYFAEGEYSLAAYCNSSTYTKTKYFGLTIDYIPLISKYNLINV